VCLGIPQPRRSHDHLHKNLRRPQLHSSRRPLRINDLHELIEADPVIDTITAAFGAAFTWQILDMVNLIGNCSKTAVCPMHDVMPG
jgi:hypothetical protein